MQFRRSDYDVTNTVQVSSVASVRRAVEELFSQTWPGANVERLSTAFARLRAAVHRAVSRLLRLRHRLSRPAALARRHARDGAAARRLRQHARAGPAPRRRPRADGHLVALFHDAGYIRQTDDTLHRNGAEFTRTHVSRGAQLPRALPADDRHGASGCRSPRRSCTSPAMSAVRPDPARRPARPQGRPPARHGGHGRADGRPLLSREVPRPPVSGVRARRRRDLARGRRRA